MKTGRVIPRIYMPVTVLLLLLGLPAFVCAMPWSWDMFKQKSYRAQKSIAPPTPEGTVSTKGKPFYVRDRAAAASLESPVEPTEESIGRGRAKYMIYCATCHGDTGKGDGPVGKKYIPPTDLTSEYVQSKPKGDIYYTITYGGMAIMPGYEDSMDPVDRWHIVNYILHSLKKEAGE